MNSPHVLNIKNKYKSLPDKYFGFEIFDEIFQVITNQKHPIHDDFNSGVSSAEAAVRRLRHEYYTAIENSLEGCEF